MLNVLKYKKGQICVSYKSGLTFILLLFCSLQTFTIFAQCQYKKGTDNSETRTKTLVKINYLQEKFAVAVSHKEQNYFLDAYLSTTESEFKIQEDYLLTLTLDNGQSLKLSAINILDYYSYFTCCDTFWVAKIRYAIPEELLSTLAQNKVQKIEVELNNRTKEYALKSKKKGIIAAILACIISKE